MGGVYGDFVGNFMELQKPVDVWTKTDESDRRTIMAVIIPTFGSVLTHRAFGQGNTAVDRENDLDIYVSDMFEGKIAEGDFVTNPMTGELMRVKRRIPFELAAGYSIYKLQYISGNNYTQDEGLTVNEGRYD